MGHFPALCPACKVLGLEDGAIDHQTLAFLTARGVISRELCFRVRKAAAAAGKPVSLCWHGKTCEVAAPDRRWHRVESDMP